MGKPNYGTYGTYVKTDSTGTQEFRYIYNAGGTAMSSSMVIVSAPSATRQAHPRSDGTNAYTQSVDHCYIICDAPNNANIAGVAIQRIPSKECGWIQTDGYCDSVNLSAGDYSVDTVFDAGTSVGAGGATMYGGPRKVGLGRLAATWSPTHMTVSACPVFLETGFGAHWIGNISAGSEGASHYISGGLTVYGAFGVTGTLSADTLVAGSIISAYSTADLYVDDNVVIGGRTTLSSTDTDGDGLWVSAGVNVTRGVSAIDAILSENIMVTNNLSATGSISSEGLSANAWIDLGNAATAGALTVTGTGSVTGNLTADSVSATGSISSEGLSANAWLDVNGLFTVDNAGAVDADNLTLVTNLTADNISATGSISAYGLSASHWLDVGGDVTIGDHLIVNTISATGSISAEGLSANAWVNIGNAAAAGALTVTGTGVFTGNLTADTISATSTIYGDAISAAQLIKVGGTTTSWDVGIDESYGVVISGALGLSSEGIIATAAALSVGTDITVDNISATGSISAYGLSASHWADIATVVTMDKFGLSSGMYIKAEELIDGIKNLKIDNISATGSISSEGLSANTWIHAGNAAIAGRIMVEGSAAAADAAAAGTTFTDTQYAGVSGTVPAMPYPPFAHATVGVNGALNWWVAGSAQWVKIYIDQATWLVPAFCCSA